MEKVSFAQSLKRKWVVGLSVLVSLGLSGVFLAQPNVILENKATASVLSHLITAISPCVEDILEIVVIV